LPTAKSPEQICADILATRGLPSKIARACGISAQAVHQWKLVPPQWVMVVSDMIKIAPDVIRPDIFKPRKPKR
jgi:hypothetical protein